VTYRGHKDALAAFLPLDAENWITQGNALRLDWLLRLKFQVQHPQPYGHRMLRWTDDTNTSMARNVA